MNERTFINLRKKIHNLKMMGTDNLLTGPVLDEINFRIKNLPGAEQLSFYDSSVISQEIGEIMKLIKSIEKNNNFDSNVVHYERTGIAPQRVLADKKNSFLKISKKCTDPVLKNKINAILTSNNAKTYDILKISMELFEKGYKDIIE
jgi:hypothetical protein